MFMVQRQTLLRQWLFQVFAALAMVSLAGPSFACESGHWVDSVSSNGEIVVLDDGTVWSIDLGDQVDTSLWLPMTDITACDDKLINTEDGEIAHAQQIR